MTNERNCENCAHAKPFGGPNDNRCDAWECEYINRQEAIEAFKARRGIVRCGECKYYYDGRTQCEIHDATGYKPSDFCSYGERRSE